MEANRPVSDSARTGAVLVTGGSGGLGAAIARRLSAHSPVAFTYRSRPEPARELAEELREQGRRAEAWQLDLDDADAVATVVAQVRELFGAVHTVVHAAGPHVPMRHLSTVEPAAFAAALHTEAAGFFNVVHAALPALRDSHGNVVAVTTAATSRFPVRDGLSAAPKAGVEELVRGFAVEEGRFGVRFNSVGPGMLTDGMAERLIGSGDLDERALAVTKNRIPLRRFGVAEDIAAAVEFLSGPEAGFITGQKLDVDGGYSA